MGSSGRVSTTSQAVTSAIRALGILTLCARRAGQLSMEGCVLRQMSTGARARQPRISMLSPWPISRRTRDDARSAGRARAAAPRAEPSQQRRQVARYWLMQVKESNQTYDDAGVRSNA